MADSFWAEAQEYKRSKEAYKDLLFQKAASLANDATKTSNNDSNLKNVRVEMTVNMATEDTTAAMAAHNLEEADVNKPEQAAAFDPLDPLKFLRFSPSGSKSDEPLPYDLRKVTEIVKKMRDDSERGKSMVKKNEWEKIDKVLGPGK